MKISQFLSSAQVFLAGVVGAIILGGIGKSVRWKLVESQGAKDLGADSPIVVAFWHGRLLMMPKLYYLKRGKRIAPPYMLISQHGDGRIIALAARLLGIRSVAGSSSRGGMRAMLELVRRVKDGSDVGFTPDGPRGPCYQVKDGLVVAAQKTGAAIVPFAYSVDRKWQLGSWDGMIIPKPFARGVCVIGDPILIPDGIELETPRLIIQNALDEITKKADQYWMAS